VFEMESGLALLPYHLLESVVDRLCLPDLFASVWSARHADLRNTRRYDPPISLTSLGKVTHTPPGKHATQHYIMELSGDLLVVLRCVQISSRFPQKTVGFRVFKLPKLDDSTTPYEWVTVENLGDHSVFGIQHLFLFRPPNSRAANLAVFLQTEIWHL
ncbi:hypothetical protein IFM89_019324, partial [Coptis chinensis]